MRNQKRPTDKAFTLVELIISISIILLLAGLTAPALEEALGRADNAVCVSNLRNIGLAVTRCAQDNDNVYPLIESDPSDPVYDSEDQALSLRETLAPYGIKKKDLRCPADAKRSDFYQTKGSSYEWFSFIDGERAVKPSLHLDEGTLILPLMRFPLTADYELVHSRGRLNILFADNHVSSYTGAGVTEDIREEVANATRQ